MDNMEKQKMAQNLRLVGTILAMIGAFLLIAGVWEIAAVWFG